MNVEWWTKPEWDGDVMEGHRVLGGVGQVAADVLQPLVSDVRGDGVPLGLEQAVQVADRYVVRGGVRGRCQIRVVQVLSDERANTQGQGAPVGFRGQMVQGVEFMGEDRGDEVEQDALQPGGIGSGEGAGPGAGGQRGEKGGEQWPCGHPRWPGPRFPSWRVRPSVTSRHRFTAAIRRWSHRSLALTFRSVLLRQRSGLRPRRGRCLIAPRPARSGSANVRARQGLGYRESRRSHPSPVGFWVGGTWRARGTRPRL